MIDIETETVTKKGTILSIPETRQTSGFKRGALIFNEQLEGRTDLNAFAIVRKGELYTENMGYSLTHLYLFTKEDVLKGTLVLGKYSLIEPAKCNTLDAAKLVATTDTQIPSARFTKQFLNEYVEADGIHEVLIAYDKVNDTVNLIKSKKNTISLKEYKKDYTRGEVLDLLDKLVKEVYSCEHLDSYKDWKTINF